MHTNLRTHPLIQRHNLTNKKLERGSSLDTNKESTQFEDTVTPLERKLYFSTAHFHLRAGKQDYKLTSTADSAQYWLIGQNRLY